MVADNVSYLHTLLWQTKNITFHMAQVNNYSCIALCEHHHFKSTCSVLLRRQRILNIWMKMIVLLMMAMQRTRRDVTCAVNSSIHGKR